MKKINIEYHTLPYELDEEIKELRTNLLFSGNEKKVILITSSLPGEGKTQTSMNLAVSLTKAQKRVLLLDCDLRKSVMISRMRTEKVEYGMTHFLSGQCTLSDALLSTNIPRLHVAFSGPSVKNAAELLGNDRMEKALENLREVYDYIIIDSAPLGLVTDSAVVASRCDGSIIVIEAGKTKYRLVQEVKRKLEYSGCPILGVVLNKVTEHTRNKYYGKEYKHYEHE